MGWAERAKVGAGNPTNERMQRRVIIPMAQTFPGKPRLFRTSDRGYVMDQRGCVRRLPPAVMAELDRRQAAVEKAQQEAAAERVAQPNTEEAPPA